MVKSQLSKGRIVQKLLAATGLVFLTLLGFAAVGYFYLAHLGRQLDESSKEYVDRVVPEIVGNWSSERLLEEAASALLESIEREELDLLFSRFQKLGALIEYQGSVGESKISITPAGGKIITAEYLARARFEHGKVKLTVTMRQENSRWRIASFFLSAPEVLR